MSAKFPGGGGAGSFLAGSLCLVILWYTVLCCLSVLSQTLNGRLRFQDCFQALRLIAIALRIDCVDCLISSISCFKLLISCLIPFYRLSIPIFLYGRLFNADTSLMEPMYTKGTLDHVILFVWCFHLTSIPTLFGFGLVVWIAFIFTDILWMIWLHICDFFHFCDTVI